MSDRARVSKRQSRGRQRMEQLLDAAAEVFGEQGYERTTTNAIAARAGVSPGTLYQFFSNKEAVADALAERYLNQLTAMGETARSLDVGNRSLEAVLDAIIDPLIAFNLANPAFHALFKEPDAPNRWAAATQRLHESLISLVESVLAMFAPGMTVDERQRSAKVSVHIVGALLPMVLEARDDERAPVIMELKRALLGYLRPTVTA